VVADRRRFSWASHGIRTAAATRTAIPRNVGLGSLYPSRLVIEVTARKAASANNKAPATRAARLSASPCASLARNLHSTTTAEKSSMALSPPNASRAGLRARQAAKRDTTASTLIHAIVTVCNRWIRRTTSGEAICNTEAIHSIMAPYSHGSWSKTPCSFAPFHLTLDRAPDCMILAWRPIIKLIARLCK
jgi:hypothetical protein